MKYIYKICLFIFVLGLGIVIGRVIEIYYADSLRQDFADSISGEWAHFSLPVVLPEDIEKGGTYYISFYTKSMSVSGFQFIRRYENHIVNYAVNELERYERSMRRK